MIASLIVTLCASVGSHTDCRTINTHIQVPMTVCVQHGQTAALEWMRVTEQIGRLKGYRCETGEQA